MKARRSKNAPFWHHWNGERGGPDVPYGTWRSKIAIIEQLSPIIPNPHPQSNDEGTEEQKLAILASLLKWGEGWSRCSIYPRQLCHATLAWQSNRGLNRRPQATKEDWYELIRLIRGIEQHLFPRTDCPVAFMNLAKIGNLAVCS